MENSGSAEPKRGRGRPMNKLHQQDVRDKIRVGQLIKVLENHALNGEGEISASRMKAMEILLRKSLPDLSAVSLEGPGENGAHVFELHGLSWLQQAIRDRN